MKKSKGFSLTVFTLTMLFFYLPLVVLVVYSFNKGKGMEWTGFSLKWYVKMIMSSDNLWKSFMNSIIVGMVSSLIATVIGTLGAIGLYWYKFKFKKVIQIFTYASLVIPDIIMGISLLIFFAGIKWKLSLETIFIAHTTFSIPYVLLIINSRLQEFDYAILEAAYDLGATEFQTLKRVILPMTVPGIVAGFLMAMTLSLDDFVITSFVAGPGSSTLPLHIYSMIRFGVSPVINVLSVFLIGVTLIMTGTTTKLQKYMV